MILIVGLGNPGERYDHTRHNLGFMVVDALGANYKLQKTNSRCFNAEFMLHPGQLLLLKPQTFMNASGYAVVKAAHFYQIPPQDIWVVHDEVDLVPGQIKIRRGGGAAGHRGVLSLIDKLNTDCFVRFRLGVGHPRHSANPHLSVEDYVLQADRRLTKKLVAKAVQVLQFALKEGLTKAMTRYNQ
jgi:PTH1 family peptidyl-tRNA hydrolase